MTYKSIVENLITEDAEKFLQEALNKSAIEFKYTTPEKVTMDRNKEDDTIYWEATFTVKKDFLDWTPVIVGGTCDDIIGICSSVIWDESYHPLWFSQKSSREAHRITKLAV